jgi:hypothetical protein
MKRPMMYFFLALVLCGVGACGRGEQEIAPEETPQKEIVVKEVPPKQEDSAQEDTIRLENPNYEVPCKGDSSAVPFKTIPNVATIINVWKGNVKSPVSQVINLESEYYKLARTDTTKLPYIDFTKYTLLVVFMQTPHPYFVTKQSAFNICKDGSISFNTEFGQGLSTVPSAVGSCVVIPKIQQSTKISFNLKVQGN